MQQDFYTVDGLASELLNTAFINLNNIPDYRLRLMLRILCVSLVGSPSKVVLVSAFSLSLYP